MSENVADKVTRTKSVAGPVFARIYNRVALNGGNVQDVIDAVFAETGIKMTENNVNVKASNIRKNGGTSLAKLSRKNRKVIDYSALNAELDAMNKSVEADKTETEANTAETKPAE